MPRSLWRMVMVALLSLASPTATRADDGEVNSFRGSPRGPIFEITHVDVIPATINGLDFQQTAYAAMFAYRDASQHDRGLESFRIVNWILAANHAQIVDVWDNFEALNRHLAQSHSVKFRFAVQNVPPPPPAPFDCCIGSPIDDRQYSLVKSFGTPWTSSKLPLTVGPTGALFVVTYVDFLAEILEQNPNKGLDELAKYGAATTKANSAQVFNFTLLQQLDRPNRAAVLEVWDTKASYDAWQNNKETTKFVDRVTPLLGSPLDHRLNILCGKTFVDGTGCVPP
jgi:quinol monooxygenase YgiN